MKRRVNSSGGQVVLLVVLIMAVIGTVTLSVASRSTSALRVQEIANKSVAAFKAAETGLEQALLERVGVGGGSGDSYQAVYSTVGENGFVTEEKVTEGEVVQVVTDGGVNLTGLKILWSAGAALKIAEFYGDSSVVYYYVDSQAREEANGFDLVADGGATVEGVDFDLGYEIVLNPETKFVRVIVLYTDSQVGALPLGSGSALPNQKEIVDSQGIYGADGDSETLVRQIHYVQGEERLPVIFDHAIYVNNSLNK